MILKGNSQFEVNKRLSATRWTTLYRLLTQKRNFVINLMGRSPCTSFMGWFSIAPSCLQIVILDYDSIISNGKQFALHLQAVVKEVELKTLICLVDKKTGDKYNKRPRFIQQVILIHAVWFIRNSL